VSRRWRKKQEMEGPLITTFSKFILGIFENQQCNQWRRAKNKFRVPGVDPTLPSPKIVLGRFENEVPD